MKAIDIYKDAGLSGLPLKWDQFSAFHKMLYGSRIVAFDTKEVALQRYPQWGPDERGVLNDLGITVFMPHDKISFDMKTPDGERVFKSWLSPALYIHDHATNHIVNASGYGREVRHEIPHRFRSWAAVYWGGPECRPYGATDVHYSTRAQDVLDKEQHAKLREIKLKCAAYCRVLGLPLKQDEITNSGVMYRLQQAQPSHANALGETFDGMTENTKHAVAVLGYKTMMNTHQVSHLVAY